MFTNTIAYIAIGAARHLDANGGLTDAASDHFGGETGFISAVLDTPGAKLLDPLATAAGDNFNSVFDYECAEAFGQQVAKALLAGTPIDTEALAKELVAACTDPSADPEPSTATRTVTAFCRESDGTGTTWISSMDVPVDATPEAISALATRQCAEDWGWESADAITCIGIAAGNITIEHWDDNA